MNNCLVLKELNESNRLTFLKMASILIMLFILIFRIKLGFIDLTPILFFLGVAYLLLSGSNIKKVYYYFILFFVFYSVYRLSIILYNSGLSVNLTPLVRDFRFIMSSVAIYAFASWIVKRGYSPKSITILIAITLLLHPVIMYIQLFFVDLRLWFIDNLPFTDNYHAFRVNGLLNGYVPGGNFLGVISAFYFFLYAKYRLNIFLFLPFLFLPLFPISGLSGLAAFSIGFFYFIIVKSGVKTKMYALVSFLIFSLALFFSYGKLSNSFPDIGKGFDRILVLFGENQNDVNATIDGSFSTLKNSYSIPESFSGLIFGNAQSSKSEFSTTTSDSGLVSNLHEFGVLGLFLLFFILFYLYKFSSNHLISVILVCTLVIFLKIDLIFSRIVFDFVMLLFAFSILSKKYLCSFRVL